MVPPREMCSQLTAMAGHPVPVLPKALRAGDRVAVVAPASPLPRERKADLERGLERLRQWGLRPEMLPNALAATGYLAGKDADRAADLQKAMSEARYRAVFCLRGGYGCTRLLPRLDFAPLARDPKPIVGFSDVTALLAAVWAKTGIVGFHGPMVAESRKSAMGAAAGKLQRTLVTGGVPGALPLPPGETPPHVLRPGTAEGPLVGGNLSLVQSLVGTPWEIETRGALLFLEDIDEKPYRLDRMLTQLRHTGALERAAGIVLGDFTYGDLPREEVQRTTTRVFRDVLGDLRKPIAYAFPFGHRDRSWTLPFGGAARLRAEDPGAPAKLELLGPAAVR